jgi:Transposase DDE domain
VLVLADRLFVDAALWRKAAATGAELVWRTKTNAVLPVLQTFADGSYLSQIRSATDRRHGIAPTLVRVVEYTLGKDPGRPAQPAPIRLLTTILDPTRTAATELAALYQQRWEFETTLDELKTHQRGPKQVLRSRSPEMVAQEVWAMLLVHHAIRRLMHQAALDHKVDPTGSPSSAACGSSAARSPVSARRPFPLSRLPERSHGSRGRSPSGCWPPVGCARFLAWSSAR